MILKKCNIYDTNDTKKLLYIFIEININNSKFNKYKQFPIIFKNYQMKLLIQKKIFFNASKKIVYNKLNNCKSYLPNISKSSDIPL